MFVMNVSLSVHAERSPSVYACVHVYCRCAFQISIGERSVDVLVCLATFPAVVCSPIVSLGKQWHVRALVFLQLATVLLL